MNRNYSLLILVICFIAGTSVAQQVPFYNHNLINPFVYNPAFTGYSGNINVFGVRNQRNMGFGTGIINNYLTVDGSFLEKNSGFGLGIMHSSAGLFQQFSGNLYYSYKIKLAEDQNLRFGVSGGFLDNRIDMGAIDVSHQDDPLLLGLRPEAYSYNLNAGILYDWNDLRVGVAVPQLIGNKITLNKQNVRGYYQLARHFLGTVEYDFKFMEDELVLTPQALVRYVPGAPFQYDITAQIDYRKLGWFSATYKSDYAIQFNLGFRLLKSIYAGYSYEFIINSFKNNYSGVNHEILLGYSFGKNEKVEIKEIDRPETLEENERLKRELQDKDNEMKNRESEWERLQREREEQLRRELEEKYRRELEEKLRQQENVEPKETEDKSNDNKSSDIRKATNYHFVEMNDSDAPNGFYVVSGVFSSDKNADKRINRLKGTYPNVRKVINKATNNRYIVIKHTTSSDEAIKAYNDFKASSSEKVWILDYTK